MKFSSSVYVAAFGLFAISSGARAQGCRQPVGPIRDARILTIVNFTFAYKPKDESGGRSAGRAYALMQLDSLGEPDGNKFVEAEGVTPNVVFDFQLLSNDQDRFTGTLALSGWGWGRIVVKARHENAYSSPAGLIRDLVRDVYAEFIHAGWYDGRPECNGPVRKGH